MEGRDTPSRGLDITAHYIATQLKLWGVEPAGMEGTYFQPFVLSRETLSKEGTSLVIAGQTFEVGEGFLPRTLAKVSAEADVVTVPSGWSNEAKGIDPYKNINVRGKIIITDDSLPEGVSARDAGRGSGWLRPEQAALAHGAVAVLYTTTQPGGDAWKRQADRLMAGGRFRPQMGDTSATLPSVTIAPDLV